MTEMTINASLFGLYLYYPHAITDKKYCTCVIIKL